MSISIFTGAELIKFILDLIHAIRCVWILTLAWNLSHKGAELSCRPDRPLTGKPREADQKQLSPPLRLQSLLSRLDNGVFLCADHSPLTQRSVVEAHRRQFAWWWTAGGREIRVGKRRPLF